IRDFHVTGVQTWIFRSVFTGKNLSQGEESRIKKYADSIVVKTAYSYQRILDEAGLFLHLVEEKNKKKHEGAVGFENSGELRNIQIGRASCRERMSIAKE